jgi:hypothetical protein
MTLTARQAKALANPLLLGGPGAILPFRELVAIGAGLTLSTALTLDNVPEIQPPRWHACATLGTRHGIVPFRQLAPLAQAALMQYLLGLLVGVGEKGSIGWALSKRGVLHAVKRATAAERTRMSRRATRAPAASYRTVQASGRSRLCVAVPKCALPVALHTRS